MTFASKGGAACVAMVLALTLGRSGFAAEDNLVGLWESHRTFGPTLAGELRIESTDTGATAEIMGHRIPLTWGENSVSFQFRGAKFSGVLEEAGWIRGHWLQPPSQFDGNVFGSPVRMSKHGGTWVGNVVPQPDTGTFYLVVKEQDDELAAQLINPERNLGVFAGLTRVLNDNDTISLLGRSRGRGEEREMLGGLLHANERVLNIRYPGRGGAYDFRKVDARDSNFAARGDGDYLMSGAPPTLNDGWRTGVAEEVGIDRGRIVAMIDEHILPATTNTHDLRVHALLIARRGKLVVEEYFRGNHRAFPHDSRSASKSVTALLAAAVMQAGDDLSWETPVYPFFDTEELLREEPERRAIRLRHLVNMNTGLDCDDRNPESAANEDYLWDHGHELDFYRHTARVDVVHAPGEVGAYCSASANLAGGVIAESTGTSLLTLIDRLIAEPLQIDRYSVPHSPDGHPYMGGGIRWLARDFLKFPQLLLDDGVWNGHRLIAADDVRRMLTPAVQLDGGRDYAYLWWIEDYSYRGGTVRAHFMGGNGGQIAMLVPELELSIVFNAGNYSDRVMFRIQQELIPNYILPAIMD